MTNESHTDWWNQYLESDDPDHVVVQMDKEIELLRDQRDSNMAKEVERIASLTTQRDEYKVWWERDSTSLGKALNEVSSLRAVREESRAAIEQLHAAVKTAQELAATRLMEIDKLRAALQTIVDFSDSAMGDGDGARDVARTALRAHAHEPSEQRPADGTRDGDGVWQGGLWHPDPPDPLDEWRLMEFAPKDGTRILALVTEVQFYRDTETPNELIPAVVKWTGEYSGWGMPGHGGLRPTLWLPIKLTNDPQDASQKPVATPGATQKSEDSATDESSRPRGLLSQGASRDASPGSNAWADAKGGLPDNTL